MTADSLDISLTRVNWWQILYSFFSCCINSESILTTGVYHMLWAGSEYNCYMWKFFFHLINSVKRMDISSYILTIYSPHWNYCPENWILLFWSILDLVYSVTGELYGFFLGINVWLWHILSCIGSIWVYMYMNSEMSYMEEENILGRQLTIVHFSLPMPRAILTC